MQSVEELATNLAEYKEQLVQVGVVDGSSGVLLHPLVAPL